MTNIMAQRLWQGVSSQPPWLRSPGQVKSALNVRHDVTLSGSAKRAATRFKADLSALTASKDYVFVALRDAIIAIGEDQVFAWDTDGTALTVVDGTGATFNSYLQFPSPGTGDVFDPFLHLDLCSSQDTLVIVNRLVLPVIANGFTYQQILNFLLTGDSTDGTHGQTATFIDTVDQFSDLPAGTNGQVYAVRFDENLDPHGQYIKETSAVNDDGASIYPEHGSSWFRIPKTGQSRARWTNNSMPHRIVRTNNTTVTFNRIVWAQRLNGNRGSNPHMPWRSKPIQTCSFQHGRLFLCSKEHFTASRTNDPFDFWDSNAGTPVDSDPIALDVNDANIGNVLRSAVCGENLMVNCENGQMQFGSGTDFLTKSNGRLFRVKSLKSQDIPLGISDERLAMIDKSGHVHHFMWAGAELGGIRYGGWMNSHAQFVFRGKTPQRIYSMPNQTFYVNESGRADAHDHFLLPDEQIQSAWGEFELHADAVFFDEWSDQIRVITSDSDGYTLLHYVHRDPDPPGALEYEPHADRLELVSGTYEVATDETVFTHTGRSGDVDTSKLTLASDVTDVGQDHQTLNAESIDTNGDVRFQGNITGSHWLGFSWTTQIEPSKIFASVSGEQSKVKTFTVFHYLASGYQAIVNDREGNPRTEESATLRSTDVLNTFFKRFSGLPHDGRFESVILRSLGTGPLVWTLINFEVDVEGNP